MRVVRQKATALNKSKIACGPLPRFLANVAIKLTLAAQEFLSSFPKLTQSISNILQSLRIVKQMRLLYWGRRNLYYLDQRPRSQTTAPISENGYSEATPPPPEPEELIDAPEAYRMSHLAQNYRDPEASKEQSMLLALYRLYICILVDDNIGMRNELELFWYQPWPVKDIPDPGAQGSLPRYAVLSAIPALLVESFNQRIGFGLHRDAPSIMSAEEREEMVARPKVLELEPVWTKNVPPLKDTLFIPHSIKSHSQLSSAGDERASPPFVEKNIVLWHPHIHFM